MSLDGLARELRNGYAPALCFVAESSIEVIGQLHGGPLHVCQHTLLQNDSALALRIVRFLGAHDAAGHELAGRQPSRAVQSDETRWR